MITLPPPIILLIEMQRRGAAADYSQVIQDGNVTVRHARNRQAVKGELPSIGLILVSDDPQVSDQQRNMDEVVREMVVDVQADIELATEDGGEDETGLAMLMIMIAIFLRSLKDEENASWLGGLCDWISVDSLEPSDRSTADAGRMTRAIRVLYRTRSDDENVLLAAGVNG